MTQFADRTLLEMDQMIHTGTIIADMNAILQDGDSAAPTYFYHLQ